MLLLGLLWQLGRRRANRLSKIPAGMGGCVCVWGLFQGFVRSSGWWLRPLPGRRWLGGLTWDCRRLVHPVLFFSFFFLAEQEVQGWPGGCSAAQHPWIAACIPEPRAKCSTLGGMGACAPGALPPPGCRRMLQPPGFWLWGWLQGGKAVPEHGDVSFPLAPVCVCSRRCSTRYFCSVLSGCTGIFIAPSASPAGCGVGKGNLAGL